MGGSPAVTVAVYAALTYDIISATNSSPQTTEINASKRAATLMKWVYIGLIQAVLFAAIGYYFEKESGRPAWPPVMGVGIAASLLWFQYEHAKRAGLNAAGMPGTESY
jgi:membrane protein required for beta-lactamase induction